MRDAKLFCERLQAVAIFPQSSYFLYIRFGQLCAAATFAARGVLSVFVNHVLGVFLRRSDEKVFGVNAVAYVARMANQQSVWYRPLVQFVRDSVNALTFAADFDHAIPARCAPSPQPTSFGFDNVLKQSFLQIHLAFLYRAISSVGSERLPYKQDVGGSNPSSPTIHNFYR